MDIYLLEEGVADYNVITSMGAYTTKEEAKNAITTMEEEMRKELRPKIIKITLHEKK